MHNAQRIKAVYQWLLHFLHLQLFLTIISLPIFLAWGLPISILSPIGNLIFGPVLTLFLFLSSLIFFLELVHLPNSYCITALETVTDWWLAIMHADCKTWLIGFMQPSLLFMLAIPVITLIIALHKKTYRQHISIACFTFLLVGAGWYLTCAAKKQPAVSTIPCNRGQVTVVHSNKQTTVIDPGYLGQRTNAASWASYTLLPTLIKQTGTTCIDHLILMQPTSMLFQAIERLCTKMCIKNIYLVYWQLEAPLPMLRSFMRFKKACTEKEIELHRIADNALHIPLNNIDSLCITPLQTTIKTTHIEYPALQVSGCVDNQEITIYSAKYKKENNPINQT
jgi:hypothetical protein